MMLIDKDIIKILSQLAGNEHIQIAYEGSDITICFLDDASKLLLKTAIYSGGNYIPSSVRRCLSHKAFNSSSIRTYLTLDERHFQIQLNYLGRAQTFSYSEFKDLLEEFGLLAEKWRHYLDENDKNDLVYIHLNK